MERLTEKPLRREFGLTTKFEAPADAAGTLPTAAKAAAQSDTVLPGRNGLS